MQINNQTYLKQAVLSGNIAKNPSTENKEKGFSISSSQALRNYAQAGISFGLPSITPEKLRGIINSATEKHAAGLKYDLSKILKSGPFAKYRYSRHNPIVIPISTENPGSSDQMLLFRKVNDKFTLMIINPKGYKTLLKIEGDINKVPDGLILMDSQTNPTLEVDINAEGKFFKASSSSGSLIYLDETYITMPSQESREAEMFDTTTDPGVKAEDVYFETRVIYEKPEIKEALKNLNIKGNVHIRAIESSVPDSEPTLCSI